MAQLWVKNEKLYRSFIISKYMFLPEDNRLDLLHDVKLKLLEKARMIDATSEKRFNCYVCSTIVHLFIDRQRRYGSNMIALHEMKSRMVMVRDNWDYDEWEKIYENRKRKYVTARNSEQTVHDDTLRVMRETLTPREFRLLMLCYDKTPYKEIMRELGSTMPAVKKAIFRMRQKAQAALPELLEERRGWKVNSLKRENARYTKQAA